MTERLHSIYRRLAAQVQAPDGDAVARLASGERDDDALFAVAASNAGADALAIALASGDDAQALASASWRAASDARRPAATTRRVALPLPWLAAAAAIAFGFTVMLKLSGPRELPQAPVAAGPAAPVADEPLMSESFEAGAVVAADSFESDARPELFSDDFDA